MTLNLIRVGIIGCGLMGYRHGMALHSIRGVRVTAVADPNPEAARALAERFGAAAERSHTDLLGRVDVDAVVIATPDGAHVEPALDAIAAGKHTLLEKPMTMSVAEARRIMQAADAATGRVFQMGHLLRSDPRYAGAAERVRRGDIGDVSHIALRRTSNIGGPRKYGRGVALHFQVSAHDADLLRFVTGLEVERVYAQATSKVLADMDAADSLLAILNLTGGALGLFEESWILPPAVKTSLDGFVEIVGTRGVILVETREQGLLVITEEGYDYPDTLRYQERDGRGGGLVREQAESFIAAIEGRAAPRATACDGYEAIRICQALADSVAAGAPVSLPV